LTVYLKTFIKRLLFQAESDLKKKIENLEQEVDNLTKENEEIKIERDDCDRMRTDQVRKNDIQLKALNQNLANLRAELKQSNDKIIQAEQTINTVKGNNLDLEARLSNSIDDQNKLLERCITAEKLCESFKLQNIELKRKLEDNQQALQELGLEHQTLQVQNYKKSNYKWIDDSTVSECTQCKKMFTVTIRKVIFLRL